MQVANTLNNNIRILFNPKVEDFKLFDFLVVKSDKDRYIAEIIEIYDDKFDASQNVAKLKIFYKITENNEVMPYDNFTPNKECEIIKIKQEEIEQFINQDKETFEFGMNVKNSLPLNIQYDFFNNNAVVLADKIENASTACLTIAKRLSDKKHTVIIDSSGMIEFEGIKKISASKNFKLPLNYATIDFIFDKCLSDASLEFQAMYIEIVNEIKKFAKKQEAGFIPFGSFTKVLQEQYEATPYPELKLLIARLKKYQLDEVFAKYKKDYEVLLKTIKKNNLTIIDLSTIETSWQKAYMEFIIEDLKDELYLVTRINDENFDVDLINRIYREKRNITFVPNVSYNYKKLPTIMQYCKNYILLPSLYQRNDFLNANFALSTLISDGCIVFGENTDEFLYLIRDYELEAEKKKKNYRKIALSVMEEDDEKVEQHLGKKGDYFENIQKENAQKTDSQRLMEELSKFEEEKSQNSKEPEEQKEENSKEEDYFETIINDEASSQEEKQEEKDEFQELEIKEKKEEIALEEMEENPALEIKSKQDGTLDNNEPEKKEPAEFKTDSDTINLDIYEDKKANQKNQETKVEIEGDVVKFTEQEAGSGSSFSEDELDFFQLSKDTSEEPKEEDKKEEAPQEEVNLSEIADNSVDEGFETIINTPSGKSTGGILKIDKDTILNASIMEGSAENSSLPIFKEKIKGDTPGFKEGDTVVHPKYGKGKITKTLMHEQRQLVHVDFETSGKKLLDPRVANIKLEQ